MSRVTYAQAVSDALREELRRNEKVFLIGEDMGVYGGCFGITRGFLEEFGPERIIDAPISEGGFTAVSYTHLDVYKRQASRLPNLCFGAGDE